MDVCLGTSAVAVVVVIVVDDINVVDIVVDIIVVVCFDVFEIFVSEHQISVVDDFVDVVDFFAANEAQAVFIDFDFASDEVDFDFEDFSFGDALHVVAVVFVVGENIVFDDGAADGEKEAGEFDGFVVVELAVDFVVVFVGAQEAHFGCDAEV